ncbi:MAG: 2-amino-4-hydroxy-6-hydroxymethyldihydropteridine diphosphokinase [Prevotella sp.]|nr:2-amino-4-hydroxy-6-hydroxymethyldihydropteridine diphosphokinase [Prevotella sp.]MCM1075014.1 2-amino-4-hydroxy-6-hydroxymethyldihydropteridine diphosphokinase [Ruminococcus sp.]
MFAIINIGSNLGHRRLNLSKAMAAVMREFGNLEMSHTVETEPHGFESPHKFLNVCLMFQTDLTPIEVLHKLQAIEKSISSGSHRNTDGSYTDREIDIDLIAIDDIVVDTPELKLPHPGLPSRYFFLKPLEEIAPGWTHPQTGLTAGEMLAALPEK